MDYKITEKTLQATLNYLATKPYQEVANLIFDIQRVERIEEKEAKEEKKK